MPENTKTPTPPAPSAPLDALLASPLVAPLVGAVPALATLAAEARRERAANMRALAAATAAAAGAPVATDGGAPLPEGGGAPIIRHTDAPTVPDAGDPLVMPAGMRATMRAAITANLPILLTGPAGCGKTSMARAVAAELARPFAVIHAASVRDSSEWFGSQTLSAGRVAWQDSPLVSALETPHTIILVDEVNRSATAAQSALLSIMDHQRAVHLAQRAEPITVAEGVVIVCTANIGTEFSATSALDAALADRPVRVECGYLPEEEEADMLAARTGIPARDARSFAALAAATRTLDWSQRTGASPISTRGLLSAASLLRALTDAGAEDPHALVLRALASHYPADAGDPTRAAFLAEAARIEIGGGR